ncbi:nucleotidyltransferase [Fructilactobacillus sanfranciscensis]|uniref:nucleotidyltransferase n=1 Tax=Fructilactobacillus sanfranciscensis TaxID=1625 RepID=UPI0011180103|nr:nucleotidyltransferase [Fructilactobacillus sanfranciscensis]TNK96232.1 nucleotidyltransferase [Fructilactobacillus sanfranciscensis]TNL01138.1 nucleotidyltransferase [Fructilactobacillus sanfranciscensis]
MTLKAVGIIAEYDPFHNGHLFQLRQAQRLTNADVTVVVMSSNWTQRGEPAIFDKWTRTKMALENEVDLVIELPIQSAVQPASIFAYNAVELIVALKCQSLSFGSESPEFDFNKFKTFEVNTSSNEFKNYQESYPENFRKFILENYGFNLELPNDTLGFWYAQAVQKLNANLKLVPIARNESNHGDDKLLHQISSGKAIRKAIKNRNSRFINFIPESSVQIEKLQPLFWDDYWPYLKYEINQTSLSDLRNVYQMSDGLEFLFKRAAIKAKNFNEFIELVKSKRYTYTRLQRLCVYVLFKITQQQIDDSSRNLRVLGMTKNGQNYLNQIKKELKLSLISKVDKTVFDRADYLECKAGLLTGTILNNQQDLYHFPVIINK